MMYAYATKRDLVEHFVRGFRRSIYVAWSLSLVFVVSSALASCDADEPHPHTVCADACDVALQVCTDAGDVAGCYLGWEACDEVCDDLRGT